jgi:uncharacterized protein YeaO (DUF488 family)
MFLNPNRVGPFFAAIICFVYHITSYYRGLEELVKEAKIKLKEMMETFRKNLQAELLEKAKSLTGKIDDLANTARSGLEDVAGRSLPGLPSADTLQNDSGSPDAGGSAIVLPSFAQKLCEDFAAGKIKSEQLPNLIQKKMLSLVTAELDALGFVDKFEFLMLISSMVSQGKHEDVKRVLIDKIWRLGVDYLESNGFSVSLKALIEQASNEASKDLKKLLHQK